MQLIIRDLIYRSPLKSIICNLYFIIKEKKVAFTPIDHLLNRIARQDTLR